MGNIVVRKKESYNKKISSVVKILLTVALYIAFALFFGVIDDDNGDFTIVRQMEVWNNKMSFDIHTKKR